MGFWAYLQFLGRQGQTHTLENVSEITIRREQNAQGEWVNVIYRDGEPVSILELTDEELFQLIWGG